MEVEIMLIEKMESNLTDDSKVYGIIICKGSSTIIVDCLSEKDADDLQFKLRVLLAKHTTEQTILR